MNASAPDTPPGPPPFSSVEEIRSKPLRFIGQLTDRYGDIVRYHVPGWTTTLLNHPEAIRYVLQTGYRNFSKLGTPDLMMLLPMLGDGLMTSVGPWWQHQRHLLEPAFRTAVVWDYAPLVVNATRDMLASWSDGGQVEICDAMAQLTLRVIGSALFSYDVGPKSHGFGAAVQMLNESVGHPDLADQRVQQRFGMGRATVRSVVEEVIDHRGKHRNMVRRDVLDKLLSASDMEGCPLSAQHVGDQVLTLLMAGHETTAKTLSWTFYLLDRHPDVAARLRADIERNFGSDCPKPEALDRVPYLWQVIQESMRLFPPVWVISRMVVEDDQVMGYRLPAGSMVVISPYVMHRHPKFWDDPERFDPERFDPRRTAERPPFAFIPFSAGPRICIGRQMAKLELQLVLAMCLQRFELQLLKNHPVIPEALVTLRPEQGLPMITHKRTAR